MKRNDAIPRCKYYVFATNKVMTRTGKEFGYGKQIDLWCANSLFEAQDAVKTLQNNKNYANAEYRESKPSFPKTASIAVTKGKPEFVFGSASHQKFVRNFAKNAERRS